MMSRPTKQFAGQGPFMKRYARLSALVLLLGSVVACNEENCGLALLTVYDAEHLVVVLGNGAPGDQTKDGVHLISTDFPDFNVPTQGSLVKRGLTREIDFGKADP